MIQNGRHGDYSPAAFYFLRKRPAMEQYEHITL